jgi:hypothetical protein
MRMLTIGAINGTALRCLPPATPPPDPLNRAPEVLS